MLDRDLTAKLFILLPLEMNFFFMNRKLDIAFGGGREDDCKKLVKGFV